MRISVVIPTFERGDLVLAAIESVLAQTHAVFEIIVVVDGQTPDPRTLEALRGIDDPKVHALVAARSLGNAAARNLGIGAAKGNWLALLDDDDTWSSDKIARQCEALASDAAHARSDTRPPIASCRLHARVNHRRFLWPRLLPRAHEPMARYLFCRRWPMTGDRLVQTSTLLAPRALFERVPFRGGRRFVDQDWLLRAADETGAELVFAQGRDALVEWDLAPDRPRVSHYRDWRWCVDWAQERHELLGPRAHAAFLLTLASAAAADAGASGAFIPLLREAFRAGRPNAAELATHCLNFALSRSLRNRIAARINRLVGS